MKIISMGGEYPYYVSDDPAKINFGSLDDKHWANGPPRQIIATSPLEYFRNTPSNSGRRAITLATLEFIKTIKGGSRPWRGGGYTTVHLDFHVYNYNRGQEPRLVICSSSGLGYRWLLIDHLAQDGSLLKIINEMPNEVAWDMLDIIYDAFSHGHDLGTHTASNKYRQAFVDGRLKKRKVRNRATYTVEIEDKPEDNGPTIIKLGSESPIASFP